MSSSIRLDSQLAAVMESLVVAAVAGLRRLTESEGGLHSHQQTQFVSMMETLCNEALGKILTILEPVKVQLSLDEATYSSSSTKPHVLYILQDSGVAVEHSYGARKENTQLPDHIYKDNGRKPDQVPSDPAASQLQMEDTAEMEPSNKAQHRWTKLTAEDSVYHRGTEESAQDENRSENEDFVNVIVKTEKDKSSERAEEMYDSLSLSSTSTSDQSLTRSVQQNHFICFICGTTASYDCEIAFREHMSTHAGDKPFKCQLCDNSYLHSVSLKRHMYTHEGGGPFKCRECGKGFVDRERLKGHMSIHTGEKAFSCDMCGKSFTAKANLSRHKRVHSGSRPYSCKECGRSYTRSETLKEHMLVHSDGERPFKCSFCDRDFNQKTNLKVHMRIHTGERPFVCTLCSKAFHTSVALRVHERVHTGEKPYICDICGRSFSQQSSLSVHRRGHLNERSYICPSCNKSFNNPQNLKLHLRVHTGERPFVCGTCGKTFVQSAHLRIHKLYMHSGVKQCVCEHCGKTYADRRNLRLHKCIYK